MIAQQIPNKVAEELGLILVPQNGSNTSFQRNLMLHEGTEPRERPPIPRLRYSNRIGTCLKAAKIILSIIMDSVGDLHQLNDTIYQAALTVSEILKQPQNVPH